MADEQKRKERKKLTEPGETDSTLVAATKAIGTAAGKIASLTGIAQPAPTPPQTKPKKPPKLQKKNKSRLPRRQKKAQQKVAPTQGDV